MDILTDMRKDMVPEKPAPEPAATPTETPAEQPAETTTASAEPATTPEPAAPAAPPPPQKGVPDYKRAFDAERYRNKALEQNYREMKAELEKLRETVAGRLPEPAKPQPPDPTQDPVGALMARIQASEEANAKRFEEWTQRQQQEAAQREHFERVTGTLKQINDIGQQQYGQDYVNALQHIVKLQAFPRIRAGMDEAEAYRQADLEVSNYALHLAHQGQNPVDLVMEYAKQYGFTPTPVQAAALATGQPPAAPVDRQAEKTRQAVAAAKSASGGGGAGTGKAFTASDIDAMYDDHPAKLADFKRQHPDIWEKYMQGKL